MRASTSDPDILVLQGGGGTRTLVGGLFILFGVAWMVAPRVVDVRSSQPIYLAYALGCWVALAAIMIGGIVAGGRWGRTFDRRHGTYTRWWGLFVPLRRKQQPLEACSAVHLEKSITETGGGSGDASSRGYYVCYPVTLIRASAPADRLCVDRDRKYFRARKTAEAIARFLDVPLRDTSSGQEVVREPSALDESFAQRAIRLGEDVRLPTPPDGSRIRCETADEKAEIALPPLGLGLFRAAFVVVVSAILIGAIAFCGVGMRDITEDSNAAEVVIPAMVVTLFLLFLFGPAVVRVLYAARSRERVSVSRQGLWIRRRFLLLGSRRSFAIDELEELEIIKPAARKPWLGRWQGKGGMRARSDRAEYEFGRSLAPEELQWLHATIRSVLVNGPPWK
jgi:hypothetical protein